MADCYDWGYDSVDVNLYDPQPIQCNGNFYSPGQDASKNIAQMILQDTALVEKFSIDFEQPVHHISAGDSIPILANHQQEIIVNLRVRVFGNVGYQDATDYQPEEKKEETKDIVLFEKKPAKDELKRKIILKAYNKK